MVFNRGYLEHSADNCHRIVRWKATQNLRHEPVKAGTWWKVQFLFLVENNRAFPQGLLPVQLKLCSRSTTHADSQENFTKYRWCVDQPILIECAGRKKMIQSEPTFFRSPFSCSKEETSDPEAMFSYEELQGEQDYPRLLHENGISRQLINKNRIQK